MVVIGPGVYSVGPGTDATTTHTHTQHTQHTQARGRVDFARTPGQGDASRQRRIPGQGGIEEPWQSSPANPPQASHVIALTRRGQSQAATYRTECRDCNLKRRNT